MNIPFRHPMTTASFARALALALASFALVACGDKTVGTAAGISVKDSDIRAIVEAVPEPTRSALLQDKASLEKLVRTELVRRALLEEARAARLDSDTKVQQELDRVRDEALVRLWLVRQATVSKDYPSDEDVKLAFQTNQAAFVTPPSYRVAQIFVSAPNGVSPGQLAGAMRKAADVGAKIPSGDFAALAREYSEHAESAAQGGDVGLLPANRMLPEIAAAVRDLQVGAMVGPIKTSQGLHYVKLLERQDGAPLSLDEARPQLVEALRARRAQELEQAYLTQLNVRLGVSVDQIALAALGKPATAAR
jgi:peptidylprolyl isomerase